MIKQELWQKLHFAVPSIKYDLPRNVEFSEKDIDDIIEGFRLSSWLRVNITSLYKCYKILPLIASGYYRDYQFQTRVSPGVPARYTESELNGMFLHFSDDEEYCYYLLPNGQRVYTNEKQQIFWTVDGSGKKHYCDADANPLKRSKTQCKK